MSVVSDASHKTAGFGEQSLENFMIIGTDHSSRDEVRAMAGKGPIIVVADSVQVSLEAIKANLMEIKLD